MSKLKELGTTFRHLAPKSPRQSPKSQSKMVFLPLKTRSRPHWGARRPSKDPGDSRDGVSDTCVRKQPVFGQYRSAPPLALSSGAGEAILEQRSCGPRAKRASSSATVLAVRSVPGCPAVSRHGGLAQHDQQLHEG
jgi:hypothetical protein